MKKIIPIFFSSDDNYIPFLDIALKSLIENASKKYIYEINILNTGLKEENINLINKNQNENFKINFFDISNKIENIKSLFKNVYHFSIATYYRLFIESMFPKYDKALYLDCDIVVLGDISKLYNIKLGNKLVGAIREQIICSNEVFRQYTNISMGIKPEKYFNAGILLMNLKKFRENRIQDQFVSLIREYNFDVVDPDQAYLNVLCKNKVKYIKINWNKESLEEKCKGKIQICHYALYKKPWQYDDVLNSKYFWHYAKKSPFYNQILEIKASFTEDKKLLKEKANIEIVEHAKKIINSNHTFYNVLFKKSNKNFENIIFDLIKKYNLDKKLIEA